MRHDVCITLDITLTYYPHNILWIRNLAEITAVLAASTETLTANTKDNMGIYNKGI